LGDFAERHPERFSPLAIDVDDQLRIVGRELREASPASPGSLVCLSD
jgi:hypothetical protein